MDYAISDLARITGAKPRSLQLWADAGVIQALQSTDRAGSGRHRRFHMYEALIACVIQAFAVRQVSIGGLIKIGDGIRMLFSHYHDVSFNSLVGAAAGERKTYLTLFWAPARGEPMIGAMEIMTEGGSEKSFFEVMNDFNPEPEFIEVVPLHIAFRKIRPDVLKQGFNLVQEQRHGSKQDSD